MPRLRTSRSLGQPNRDSVSKSRPAPLGYVVRCIGGFLRVRRRAGWPRHVAATDFGTFKLWASLPPTSRDFRSSEARLLRTGNQEHAPIAVFVDEAEVSPATIVMHALGTLRANIGRKALGCRGSTVQTRDRCAVTGSRNSQASNITKPGAADSRQLQQVLANALSEPWADLPSGVTKLKVLIRSSPQIPSDGLNTHTLMRAAKILLAVG